jgi:hypothetical protein
MWVAAALGLCVCVTPGVRAQTTGSIEAWGDNSDGQCDVPAPNTGFVAVAAGAAHSLGLRADGSIEAWGDDYYGQLNVPLPNIGFVAIAGGAFHSLGLRADGSIEAWGGNWEGQCDVPAPNTGFVAVAGGYKHSLGLRADGSIAAWGWNDDGQLNVPAPNTGFVAVAAGGYHSLGLRADGSIEAWGWNGYGQCDVPAPNTGFVAVAGSYQHNLGLKGDGSIAAWGKNDYGQCDVPAPNTGFVAISALGQHSVGLRADGSIAAWGRNQYGQCDVPAPNTGFVAVAGGNLHSLGLRADQPAPPFLLIETPATDLTLQQGERMTISWLDDAQHGAEIRLFADPDTGPTPWNQGGADNEIRIPFSVDAFDPHDQVQWHVADLAPGLYSVWGKSDNGIDPPAYSRAPGLVTVTEFTDDTPPEIDQERLDIGNAPSPVFVLQAPTPKNLYLVTHGWNGQEGQEKDHSWIKDVATAVAGQDDGSGEWDVAYYDWRPRAGDYHGPGPAATEAITLGLQLADAINANGYEYVEVVAHSAGSWMGHAIAHQLQEPYSDITVNLVLLDAYVPPEWLRDGMELGADAHHVFNCYDHGWWPPFTQSNLPNAFNVDMTCRREQGRLVPFWPYDGSSHGAPWAWYRVSTVEAGGYLGFMDDDSYSYDGQPAPLGFGMSKAYSGSNGGWDETMSRYPANGDNEFNVCSGFWDGCDADTTVFVEYPDVFDLTALTHTFGPDGTVTLVPDSAELSTGTESAWVGFDVPLARAVSAVLFDVEFTSADPNAEGYATGYWNGLQLASADERFTGGADPGGRSFTFMETIAPGQKVISFRVDNNGGPTSSVFISNLRTGINLDVDINGDCVATADDLCAWAAEPYDLDGNGIVDADDQSLLATALGVSGADTDGDGIPDVCEVCAPDLNGDGLVNTQDFLAFLNLWVAGDPIADWNDDGTINTQDFLAYLNDWSAGC